MPRFELDGELWEIAHDDKELSIIANGKATQRTFVSTDHAATQYAKLVAEKVANHASPGSSNTSSTI